MLGKRFRKQPQQQLGKTHFNGVKCYNECGTTLRAIAVDKTTMIKACDTCEIIFLIDTLTGERTSKSFVEFYTCGHRTFPLS